MTGSLDDVVGLTLWIALGFLVAVAFYESLCKRDVLVAPVMRSARRVSRRPWIHGVAYVLSVAVGIPLLVVVWTLVLWFTLVVIGSLDRVDNVATVSVAIVAATRILAYVRQKTAHELAKAIPLALALLLITGGTLKVDANLAIIGAHPERASFTAEMTTFLIGLEIALRLVTDGSRAALAGVRRRRNLGDDLGAWRTLLAVLQQPRSAAPNPESGTSE